MKKNVLMVCVALFLTLIATKKSPAYEIAWALDYPFDSYSVTGYYFGDPAGGGGVHVGEDIVKEAGTPVRAIGNGEVKLVKTDSQGYEQVVVIEHTLRSGEKACSIYGHLSEKTDYPLTSLGSIEMGETVGYIGWHSDDPEEDENGIGGSHLHLGIRKGAYVGLYEGRSPSTTNFHKPSEFIAGYNVGFFPDGWQAGTSDDFLTAYLVHGGHSELGSPWDNSYVDGPYVHCWPDDCTHHDALDVQDFLTEDGEWSMLVRNEHKDEVYLVKGCVLHEWFFGWGYSDYGPPTEDTHCVGDQCFKYNLKHLK